MRLVVYDARHKAFDCVYVVKFDETIYDRDVLDFRNKNINIDDDLALKILPVELLAKGVIDPSLLEPIANEIMKNVRISLSNWAALPDIIGARNYLREISDADFDKMRGIINNLNSLYKDDIIGAWSYLNDIHPLVYNRGNYINDVHIALNFIEFALFLSICGEYNHPIEWIDDAER